MKYAAIKMDLHKANKEANEGTMMLNMARGLIESAQTLQANGGDPKRIDALMAEANEYLRSAHSQLFDATALARETVIDIELARKEAADSE
jgi:hypothetical protein|tara:strand:+ start:177 stop:449 length:273 start_codon:yes stop_codon:yes gene_type:complete